MKLPVCEMCAATDGLCACPSASTTHITAARKALKSACPRNRRKLPTNLPALKQVFEAVLQKPVMIAFE